MEPVERRSIVRVNNMNPACQTFGVHYQLPVLFAGLLHANLESKVMALRAGTVGEVECFAQDVTADLVTQGNHSGIVGAWTEPVCVGEIEELAEQVRSLDTRRAACRECYVFRCTGHFRCAVTKACKVETSVDGHSSLVDQMHVEAVKALVGDEGCYRAQNLREPVPGAFGRSQCIDYTPARTRPQILQLPDDPAGARRAMAAPFREDFGHDLGHHRARQVEITLGVFVSKAGGIDLVERAQVVLAHVVEVPARAGVSRHSGLPARLMRLRCERHGVERDIVWDVGERQAFAGEPDVRTTG